MNKPAIPSCAECRFFLGAFVVVVLVSVMLHFFIAAGFCGIMVFVVCCFHHG